jgi:hypothetical protein
MKTIARPLLVLLSFVLFGFGPETASRPNVTAVRVGPSSPAVGVGRTLQMTATASYSDGTSKDVTNDAVWLSSDRRIVTIGNVPFDKGIATGVAAGSVTVTANYLGVKGQANVAAYVLPAPSFAVQPTSTGVAVVIAPAVTVLVLDPAGKPITGQLVTMAIGPLPPHAAILGGTLSHPTDASGRATFSDLTLDWLGNGYTLVATAPTPGGPYATTSAPFDENRVGDPCLGPSPACASSCADSDGDGLNDAWEQAGGIDFNGDGRIDPAYDLLLPDADPANPDVYVQADYMDYGLNEYGCESDVECTNLSIEHAGDTCAGPPAGSSAKTCVHACVADPDCTGLGPSHVGDRCSNSLCRHTHDPDVVGAGALDAVVAAFAAHGVNLHIDPVHQAVPHSHVVTFDEVFVGCTGVSVPPGEVGAYAVSFYDVKSAYFDPRRALAYHYAVFGHYSSCDDAADCKQCGYPPFATGIAELPGNDLIVSLGHFFNDQGGPPLVTNVGGTFMHELGHNLNLHHGGGTEDLPNYKPNYLSVMNYSYQLSGILESDAVGSDQVVGSRLDYAVQVLPTGGNTPGALTENGQLSEPAGLGSGTADVFTYNDGECGFDYAASDGPVDWDGDGVADNPTATSDLDQDDHPIDACSVHDQVLRGHADWGPSADHSLGLAFQCLSNSQNASVGPSVDRKSASRRLAADELTPEMAMRAHVLYPPRRVTVRTAEDCDGIVTLLGADGLDVNDVDPTSLRLSGASASRVSVDDVDGDGKSDLVIVFDAARMKSRRGAARFSGWLWNSQVIQGRVEVESSGAPCR